MNSLRLLKTTACAAMAWAALAAPSLAATFSNNWSFVDTISGQTVSGVISGLENGDGLSADGLTITVTTSPYDVMLGEYTFDFGANSGDPSLPDTYSAAGGVITFANFIYANEVGEFLTFGSAPGGGTRYPYFVSYNTLEEAYNQTSGMQFSAVSAPGGVPEPASWALMIGGFGLAGAALRRRQATTSAAA